MNQYLNTLKENRKALVEIIQQLTVEQFNLIPQGHNNNIIWNLGHMLVVSESILYKNSGFRPPVHEFDTGLFGRNTSPEEPFSKENILLISDALLKTAEIFEQTTGFGHTVEKRLMTSNSLVTENALQFLLLHENLHYRTIGKLLELV